MLVLTIITLALSMTPEEEAIRLREELHLIKTSKIVTPVEKAPQEGQTNQLDKIDLEKKYFSQNDQRKAKERSRRLVRSPAIEESNELEDEVTLKKSAPRKLVPVRGRYDGRPPVIEVKPEAPPFEESDELFE